MAAAVAGTDAPILVTPIDATHVRCPADSGVAVGEQVVYRAPVSVPFTSALVDVDSVDSDVNGTDLHGPGHQPRRQHRPQPGGVQHFRRQHVLRPS